MTDTICTLYQAWFTLLQQGRQSVVADSQPSPKYACLRISLLLSALGLAIFLSFSDGSEHVLNSFICGEDVRF